MAFYNWPRLLRYLAVRIGLGFPSCLIGIGVGNHNSLKRISFLHINYYNIANLLTIIKYAVYASIGRLCDYSKSEVLVSVAKLATHFEIFPCNSVQR